MTDNELYQEENRNILLEIRDALKGFTAPTIQLKDSVKFDGELKVNTQKSVEVTNIHEFIDSVSKLADTIETAIKNNSYKPEKNITVDNIKDAQPTELKVNNLKELSKYFTTLEKAIKDNQPIVNVTKQSIVFPTSANNPISVRLSDGKSFYNSIQQAISTSSGETDPLVGYQPSDIDDTSTPKYYGFVKANGAWYIMRESSGAYRYTVGSKLTSYSTSWSGRSGLTYSYFYEVF